MFDSVTPWTIACQAPLSMEFSRQGYWSGLPFPFPEHLPDPGIEPGPPAWQVVALPSELLGKSNIVLPKQTEKPLLQQEVTKKTTTKGFQSNRWKKNHSRFYGSSFSPTWWHGHHTLWINTWQWSVGHRAGKRAKAAYRSQMWPLEQTACLRSVNGKISLHKLQCSGKVCLFIFFEMCPIST